MSLLNICYILLKIFNALCNNVEIYAVPEGNHGGYADYFAIKALEYATNSYFPIYSVYCI